MRYRALGTTGLSVSEIGFGTIPILSGSVPVLPDYYNLDMETAISLMRYALELGCNIFDTAIVPEYGDAEIKLGVFAKQAGRERIIIADKARFYSGNEMYAAVCQSVQNLNTYPDIYFVHQVDFESEDEVFGRYGAIDALTELKDEGKIRFVGVASHYYDILLRGAKDSRIDILQGSGNILERGMLDRIEGEPLFRPKGILINKLYAAGILPAFFQEKDLIEGVLSYPVSSVLIGLGHKEQVDISMKKEYYPPARMEFQEVLYTLGRYFDMLACDRCQRCKCIYGTEIHTVFRQYNYYFMGKNYWALRKLELSIEKSAAACGSCTELSCMKQCPKGLRIPQIMQKVADLVKKH